MCPSNSKQLSHNQTVLMTSHYFDFDAVTHITKDVSVSARQSRIVPDSWVNRGYIAVKNLKPNFAQVPEQSEFTESGYLVAAEEL